MYETHKELFRGHFTILDQVRSYRFGVTDTLNELVNKYEKCYGPDDLDRRVRHTKKWQEGELIRWNQIKEEVTGWDEEDYDD